MPLTIKQLPKSERPYEKAKLYGFGKLSCSELLAIIIKNGTHNENSLDIANRILLLVNDLSEMENLSLKDLQKIKGIGEVKSVQIKAIFELAKRINSPLNKDEIKLTKPKDIANLLMNEMKFEKQEKVKVLLLNTKNVLISMKDIVIGETNFAQVTPKQIFVEAIKMQVNKIILVHNHPSGDPTPSREDYELTNHIIRAGDLLGVRLLDHIVIGNNRYESIFSRRDFLDCI